MLLITAWLNFFCPYIPCKISFYKVILALSIATSIPVPINPNVRVTTINQNKKKF